MLDEDAVLATTTSSLSVAELAQASGRPDRFGALHVFNPVDRMKLVELSFPDSASEDTKRRLHQLCEELDKTAKDYQGKRREWILKEIKNEKCCGPFTDCSDKTTAAT